LIDLSLQQPVYVASIGMLFSSFVAEFCKGGACTFATVNNFALYWQH